MLFLCHAKPKNAERARTWKKLVENTLESPDTWEVALSAGKDKRETWEWLLREGKVGRMAKKSTERTSTVRRRHGRAARNIFERLASFEKGIEMLTTRGEESVLGWR